MYIQEVVGQLYWLNTHYFEEHSVESADRKDSDVREKLQQTLAILDSVQGILVIDPECSSHDNYLPY